MAYRPLQTTECKIINQTFSTLLCHHLPPCAQGPCLLINWVYLIIFAENHSCNNKIEWHQSPPPCPSSNSRPDTKREEESLHNPRAVTLGENINTITSLLLASALPARTSFGQQLVHTSFSKLQAQFSNDHHWLQSCHQELLQHGCPRQWCMQLYSRSGSRPTTWTRWCCSSWAPARCRSRTCTTCPSPQQVLNTCLYAWHQQDFTLKAGKI